MQIDYCLILAAGFGSRMGQIGKHLPKVLWPVFEKSLLELQVGYAKSLGINKIYVNLHFKSEEIQNYCSEKEIFRDVEFLVELPEILDIGGAIHNLASRQGINYRGRLLVLNSDQFFYLNTNEFNSIVTSWKNYPVVLLNYFVNSSDGYNALKVDDKKIVRGIIPNKELPPESKVETYTGISIIDLSRIEKVPGVSKFFESVCLFEKNITPAILLKDASYWDFGTIQRYWDTMFRILQTYYHQPNHPFIRFLVQQKAIKSWKIGMNNLSYHAKSPGVVNLNIEEEILSLPPVIILKGKCTKPSGSPQVWWNEISDSIS